MVTPAPPHPPKQAREHQNWTREQWTKVTLSAKSHFYMCAAYLGSARHQNAQQTGQQPAEAICCRETFGALIH